MNELDRRVVRGSAWLALSYGGSQIVGLSVTVVLAHLLTPSAFGLVGLASVAIAAAGILQESGLGTALIWSREDVESGVSTTFVFSALASIVLYVVAFLSAPLVADLFSQHRLTAVLRVLALVLVLRGLAGGIGAAIEREMLFHSRARIELGGVAGQAAVSLSLAASGAGVWSLVFGQLAGQFIQTAISWSVAPIRPDLRRASWQTLRRLARYGRFVTAANVVALFDGNLDTVTVGRLAGAAGVGFYGMAWRVSNLPATGLGYIVGRVMLPAYATLQDDLPAFRAAFLTNFRRVALISLPLSLTLLLGAHDIVAGVFGRRWEPAVVLLEILSVFGLIRSFSGITGAVFQAKGRPQLVFLLSSWHLIVLVASLGALAPFFRVEGVAIAMTISAFASAVPAYVLVLRILHISVGELLSHLVRPAMCSAPVALAVAAVVAWGDSLQASSQIALLVVCVSVAYAAGLATVGRAEVRLIRAAFRT